MLKEKLKGFAVGVVVTSVILGTVPTMAEKMSKTAELFYNNIKVIVDGQRADLKDANGNQVEPFIIDGTTYLPVRGVANAMNKAVSWDGATQTVYLGANDEIQQPSVWLKDLETFTGKVEAKSANEIDFGGYEYNNLLTANTGDIYQNYLYPYKYASISNVEDTDVSYLLNYKYSRFKGTFYLAKGSKDYSSCIRMVVYGDDKVIYTTDGIKSGNKPIDFDIDVSNVGTLKIVYQIDDGYDWSLWGSSGNHISYDFIHNTPIGNAGLYE